MQWTAGGDRLRRYGRYDSYPYGWWTGRVASDRSCSPTEGLLAGTPPATMGGITLPVLAAGASSATAGPQGGLRLPAASAVTERQTHHRVDAPGLLHQNPPGADGPTATRNPVGAARPPGMHLCHEQDCDRQARPTDAPSPWPGCAETSNRLRAPTAALAAGCRWPQWRASRCRCWRWMDIARQVAPRVGCGFQPHQPSQ